MQDSPEKEMATHSSVLAWRIPWMEEPGGLSPRGCKELDMTEHAHTHTHTHTCIHIADSLCCTIETKTSLKSN